MGEVDLRRKSFGRIGVWFLINALALSIIATAAVPATQLYVVVTAQTNRMVFLDSHIWLYLAYLALDATIGILGLLALGFIYRGRGELGPPHASKIRRAAIAMIAGSMFIGSRAAAGLLVGYIYLPDLARWLSMAYPLLASLAATFLGLFLYWTAVDSAPPRGTLLARLALPLGIAGSILTGSFYLEQLTSSFYLLFDFLGILGWALGVASLALWLVIYLGVLRWFGMRDPNPPDAPSLG